MPTLQEIVLSHRSQHPEAEPVDLYKLARQATYGDGARLIEDARAPLASILDEIDGLDLEPRDWEPVVEPISVNTDLARVHLRPFFRAGGDPRRLARALIGTAESFGEAPEQLAALLGELRAVLRSEWPEMSHLTFDKLLREQASDGFGVLPHSEIFLDLYDPHYRVVSLKQLAE